MKINNTLQNLVGRVTDRFSPESFSPESNSRTAKSRKLAVEALEPRILFSVSPTPVEPAPAEAPDAQEAQAPADSDAAADPAPEAEATAEVTAVAAPPEATVPAPEGAADQGDTAVALTDAELSSLADAAASIWASSGTDAAQGDALADATYQIADLSGIGANILGATEGNVITIDDDAAGRGWFVDGTPEDNSEFSLDGSATTSSASGGIDLLSVLLHEQGHILGMLDVYGSENAGDIMNGVFVEGERRLLTEGQADGAVAGSLEGVHYAITPGGIITGETATARSDFFGSEPWGRPAANAVNDVGMMTGEGATGVHQTSGFETGWQVGQAGDIAHWFKVDLGDSYDVENMYVWNGLPGLPSWGAKTVDIYYSTTDPGNNTHGDLTDFNTTGWNTWGTVDNLAQYVSGSYTPTDTIALNVNARYIVLNVTAAYSGINNTSIAELQFSGTETAQAAPIITGETATASSDFFASESWGRPIEAAVNDTGMTGEGAAGLHAATSYSDGWQASQTTAPWIKVDLGATYDVENMYVWNGSPADANWGAQTVDIYYSTTDPGVNVNDSEAAFNPADWTLWSSGVTFAKHAGSGSYLPTDTIALDVNARYIALNVTAAHGGINNTSIAELQFSGTENEVVVPNTAPTIDGTVASQAVDDNLTVSPFSGVTIDDAEGDSLVVTVTLSDGDANGMFSAASLGSFVKTAPGVYTFTGTKAVATTAIQALVFEPTENQVAAGLPVTTTFTISVIDDGDGALSATDPDTTVIATSINDAPVLAPGVLDFNDVGVSQFDNDGDLISYLVSGQISDDDNPSVEGIAITGAGATGGKFQYSTNGGGSWTDVGTVSDTEALLLTTTAMDRIRFLPDGTTAATSNLTFRAWDQTGTGAVGDKVVVDTSAGPIISTGISATASSDFGDPFNDPNFTYFPSNAVDGNGMTSGSGATGMHSQATNGRGWTAVGGLPQWFRVDLGDTYDVETMYVWNGQPGDGLEVRGIRLADIYYSTVDTTDPIPTGSASSGDWILLTDEQAFASKPGGTADYGPTDAIALNKTARVIALDITALQASGSNASIAELQFEPVVVGGGTTPFSADARTVSVSVAELIKDGTEIVYSPTTGETNTLTVTHDGTTGELVFVDSTGDIGGTREARIALNLDDDLTIETGDENDTITIGDLGNFNGELTIDGGADQDQVIYQAKGVTLGAGKGASFTAEEIDFWAGSDLTTTDGDITAVAEGGTGNLQGVHVYGASLTTGTGNVTLDGDGGDTGNSNIGVNITNGGSITTGGGNIDIDGQGGGAATSVASKGVLIHTGSSLEAVGNGTITIDGTAGDGSLQNDGVFILGADLTVADGDMTINGTGTGASGGDGVSMIGSDLVGTGVGNITITGTSESTGGTGNQGITLASTTIDTTAGTGTVTLSGTGSAASLSNNEGVRLADVDIATGGDGAIDIDGIAGGTALGNNNTGVALIGGSTVVAGGAGTVNIDGTAGAGTIQNRGVYITGAGSEVKSTSGAITINGTGNGTGSMNRGIETGFATIETAGAIDMEGTGSTAASGSFNGGIYLAHTTLDGTSTLVGNGGSGSSFNEGVRLLGGTVLGDLTLTGTANSGTTGVFNSGAYILGTSMGTATGSITGVGGGGLGFNHGIYFHPLGLSFGGSTDGDKGDGATSVDIALLPLLMAASDKRARRQAEDAGGISAALHTLAGKTWGRQEPEVPDYEALDSQAKWGAQLLD